jgi:DNA polymerase elongation subunit (family B)
MQKYTRKSYCYKDDSEKGLTIKTLKAKEPIHFQALDWFSKNERVEIENESDASEDSASGCSNKITRETQYFIYCFGITQYGETITIRLDDYTPYFYVKVPLTITEEFFKEEILETLIESNFTDNKTGYAKNSFELYKKDLIDCCFCTKKDFWGFQEEKLSKFARLTFKNTYALKAYEKAFTKPIKINKQTKIHFKLYESNIDSMLRFFHWRSIEPCGWLCVENYEYIGYNDFSNSMFEITCNWKQISSKPEDKIGRIFEASFDIECDSSDGSFPLAKKDWGKIINPILEYYIKEKPIDINDYIRDKVENNLLILKNKKDKYQLSPKNLVLADEYFKILCRLVEDKVNCEDSKEKKLFEPKIERARSDLITFLNANLGELEGDKAIQIGTTVFIYELNRELEFMFTLQGAVIPDKPNLILKCFSSERELLLEWTKLIQKLDPDVLTGYNIFGFDMKFLYYRAVELGIKEEFLKLSRYEDFQCPFKVQDLSSSALGKNILEYIDIPGRVVFDTMKYIRRNHQLDSYKLDAVINNFMRGDIKKTEVLEEGKTWVYSEISEGVKVGNYITLQKNNYVYEDKYRGGEKINILDVDKENSRFLIEDSLVIEDGWKYSWSEGKDDIDHHQIFEYQKGSDEQRGVIAKYCLQDCKLCNRLLNKLDTIVNSVAMANVNCVPISFIFNRGQGIKLFSFVAKEARLRNYCIPLVKFDPDNDESYEGAFVLDPKTGIYFEDSPIAVADFNSLYPSCMISENLCHSTICLDEKYKGEKGAELLKSLGYEYADIEWDIYEDEEDEKARKKREKEKLQQLNKLRAKGDKLKMPKDDKKRVIGKESVRFVQPRDGKKGVLPSILEVLLKCRKDVRAKQKTVKDPLKWKVLEGQQLAFKVTANSLYGVTGASTSPLCLKNIAAATTATGRKNIMFAKDYVESHYPGTEVVYGDTDSIFIKFNLDGLKGLDAIYKSIEYCEEATGEISKQLKRPHNLEFEKVICPMILCAKKKYVGFYYTSKSPKYTIKYMGIVLKRRDNAPIVKHVFGEAIHILLKENNVKKAIEFVQTACAKILEGQYGMDKFIMSKTLKDNYDNPESIAHKVLADRMGEREPGNKPQVNDRIPFIYIEHDVAIKCLKEKQKKILQGDKIEHPDYIIRNKLPIDYLHYITNQIVNPVCQVFDLVMENSEEIIFGALIAKEEKRRQMLALRKRGYQDISKFFVKVKK